MRELLKSFHDWKQDHISKYGRIHPRDWYCSAYGKYCRLTLEAMVNRTPRVEFQGGVLKVVLGDHLKQEWK